MFNFIYNVIQSVADTLTGYSTAVETAKEAKAEKGRQAKEAALANGGLHRRKVRQDNRRAAAQREKLTTNYGLADLFAEKVEKQSVLANALGYANNLVSKLFPKKPAIAVEGPDLRQPNYTKEHTNARFPKGFAAEIAKAANKMNSKHRPSIAALYIKDKLSKPVVGEGYRSTDVLIPEGLSNLYVEKQSFLSKLKAYLSEKINAAVSAVVASLKAVVNKVLGIKPVQGPEYRKPQHIIARFPKRFAVEIAKAANSEKRKNYRRSILEAASDKASAPKVDAGFVNSHTAEGLANLFREVPEAKPSLFSQMRPSLFAPAPTAKKVRFADEGIEMQPMHSSASPAVGG